MGYMPESFGPEPLPPAIPFICSTEFSIEKERFLYEFALHGKFYNVPDARGAYHSARRGV
ncbi:hypothetical protein YDYSG_30810 [Paenibacillus tyrfis]|nr:hypothetical protein YDYSG_30810 [Paenibacillus tyrfis]